MATIDKLIVEVGADIKDLQRKLKTIDKNIGGVDKNVKKASSSFDGLGGAITAALSVGAVISFGKAVVDTLGEFQKMGAVLTNTLGSSSAAKKAMDDIMLFASRTPFAVKELTNTYVKLANQGIKPSMQQMTALGDIAASTGKSFDQLGEAVIDASTSFEFERLKEFGIRAKRNGDQVAFTFKGVTTEVKATTANINDYIISLGEAEGVTGAMAAISDTVAGKISNLGDNYDTFLKVVGEGNTGAIAGAIDALNSLLSSINETEKATQRAAQLGFRRGLFQELKGTAMQVIALDNAVKANVSTFDKQGTTVEQVKNAIGKYLKAAKELDTSTKEGKAKLTIYSDAMLTLKDRLNELKKPTEDNTTATANYRKELEAVQKVAAKGITPTFSQPLTMQLATPKEGTGNPYADMVSNAQIAAESIGYYSDEAQRKIEELGYKTAGVAEGINIGFSGIASVISEQLGVAGGAMASFVQAASSTFLQIMAKALSVAMANAIMGASGAAAVAGPFAPAVLPATIATMTGSVLAAFAAIPQMADGGVFFGESLAMVGEGRGTSLTNPEVIAPLDKLKSFIGNDGGNGMQNVKFELEGQKLVGVINRYNNQNRY